MKAKVQKQQSHPGLPGYNGPKKGWFFMVHHQGPLIEYCSSVQTRVYNINIHKSSNEKVTRLNHLVTVPIHLLHSPFEGFLAAYVNRDYRIRHFACSQRENIIKSNKKRLLWLYKQEMQAAGLKLSLSKKGHLIFPHQR